MIRKHVKGAAIVAAGLAVSYAGVKFSTDPHVRQVTYNVLRKIGSQKIPNLDPFEGYNIVGKNGSPLTPDAIERLMELGIL